MARLIAVSIDCRNEAARHTFEEIVSRRRDYLVTKGQGTGVADMLLLELDELRPQQTFARIRELLNASPDLEVFLTASRTDPQALLEAFRVGVKEFLPQPLTRQEVCAALALPFAAAACARAPGGAGTGLTVYAAQGAEITTPVLDAYTRRRPGLGIDLVRAGTGEMLARVRAEKKHPRGDVFWGGYLETYTANADLFAPVLLAEEKLFPDQDPARKWHPFTANVIHLVVSTERLAEPPPSSFAELAHPRWRRLGGVALSNPAASGTGYTIVAALSSLHGWGYVVDLLRNCRLTDSSDSNILVFLVSYLRDYLFWLSLKVIPATFGVTTPVLEISYLYIHLSFPIFMGLMLLYLIGQIFRMGWRHLASSCLVSIAIIAALYLIFGTKSYSGPVLVVISLACTGLLITFSMPIVFALGIGCALFLVFFKDYPHQIMHTRMVGGIDSFPLLAVPFFIRPESF